MQISIVIDGTEIGLGANVGEELAMLAAAAVNPAELLSRLARHPSKDIRRAVALRSEIGCEAWELLARDSNPEVSLRDHLKNAC